MGKCNTGCCFFCAILLNIDLWFLLPDVPFDADTTRKLLCPEWHIQVELCLRTLITWMQLGIKIHCLKVKDWNKFAYLCSVLNILNETQFRFETIVSPSFPFFMSSQIQRLVVGVGERYLLWFCYCWRFESGSSLNLSLCFPNMIGCSRDNRYLEEKFKHIWNLFILLFIY